MAQATAIATGAELSTYEKARRLAWLLGDNSGQPAAEVEGIVWRFSPADQVRVLDGISELPACPEALPADQIARYSEHTKAADPQNRRPCVFCGAMVFDSDDVCWPCQPKRKN